MKLINIVTTDDHLVLINPAKIVSISVDPDDPKTTCIECGRYKTFRTKDNLTSIERLVNEGLA